MRDIKNTNLKKQIAIGEKLFLSGRVDEAKHHFEKLLDKYPSLASINNNLGVIYFHEGKPKKALLAFKAALKNDPYYIDALINVISLLGKNGLRDKELLSILLPGLEKNILPRQAIFPITLRWEWVEFLTSELISRSSWREATRLIIEYRIRTPDNISRDFFIKYLSNKPLRLCLVMDQGIGNMVMLTPTIRAIKKLLPKSLLDVVGKKGSLQVIEGWDLVHESFDYLDFKPSNKYDILLLTIWSNEFIKKHEKKINALDIPIIKKSFTNPDRHESQYHLDLARFIGYQGELPEPYCRTDRVTVPFKNSKPVALLSDTTFNSPEWQRKRWPYYRELAKALIEKGYQVGLIGGLDEANNFRQDDWPKGIINLMGKYTIPETAYLISKADLFVGNDSGPSHVAAAMETQTIVIFGPTRVTKNKPLGPHVEIVISNLPCSPCQYTERWKKCSNWRCMSNIYPEEILKKTTKKSTPSPKIESSQSQNDISYIIGTGWYCTPSGNHSGVVSNTDPIQRSPQFSTLWYQFIDRYTKPEKIIVVDSASPLKPLFPPDPRIEFLSLRKNFGHAREANWISGWALSVLQGAIYSYFNNVDYFIYVEQDVLVRGVNWIQHAIAHLKNGKIMFGKGFSGDNNYPIEQSLIIIHKKFIPTFINRYLEISKSFSDAEMRPEQKFFILFKNDVDYLPFGYGRARPINFEDQYLYIQHWTKEELNIFLKSERNHLSSSLSYQDNAQERKIHLACGTNILPGWENYDIDVDIRKPLPFPSDCAKYIFIEHGLEHIEFEEAKTFLFEARRVLAQKGILRIATPSFPKIYREATKDYLNWLCNKGWAKIDTKCGAINALFYCHGHRFIYDYETLTRLLKEAGFKHVRQETPGTSAVPELKGLESHGKVISEAFNHIETIVVEASRSPF